MSDAPERIWCLPGETDDLRLNPKDWARPCNDAIPYIRADFVDALIREAIQSAEAERDALRAALVDHNDLLRSASQIAKREGINGEIASTNWGAYYNRVAVALKRHHAISNEARQALKGTNHD